jgi:hypothetical protein
VVKVKSNAPGIPPVLPALDTQISEIVSLDDPF